MTPTTARLPAGGYPIIPAANRHWLTPLYDLGCELLGLGRAFQRDVLARLGLRGGERLIDLGGGTGTLLAETLRRHPGATAAGVDADPAVLAIAARRLSRYGTRAALHAARAEALPFPDGSFDVAVSTLAVHHLPTPAKRAAFAEVHRVLRPGAVSARRLRGRTGRPDPRVAAGGRGHRVPQRPQPRADPRIPRGRRVRGGAGGPPAVARGRLPRGRAAGVGAAPTG